MKKFTNFLIVFVVLIYFISPVDLFPGLLIDDVIVIIMALVKISGGAESGDFKE